MSLGHRIVFALLVSSFCFAGATAQAPAVATGDSRTVTEPSFPAVCTTLTAQFSSVNDDLPTSVDATNTNPDGARIQAALTGCANTNQSVRLSIDGAGHNAYLTGPLNMPSGVTLLVDPGVVVYFSRNVQDYDVVAGTHTCGTVNSNSATSSCLPLININNVSNVGIMGFGKLDGRGGDTLLNAFPSSYAGQSWWGLSAIANSGGNQQNPRFIQISGSTNITLYKITLRNSPLFHISMPGSEGVNGMTAWDIKIVTPTTARNTDGIDPDNAQNVTVTKSWISDGDDNVAVGSSGATTGASINISIINNHLFAGHGESIGSYTSAGVSNILYDSNMLAGNSSVDSNSTGIRIKSANDRGGYVHNIQYSNSCFQNHKTEIQFTPLYNTNTGTLTPDFQNILLQNLSFLTEGTVQFTGASNNGTVYPLTATLDNVSFATLATSDFSAAPTNAALTYGPGQVSSNFVNAYATFVGSNGDTVTDNRTAPSLAPPACTFTFIAPELTGPAGLPQTVTFGQVATAVVILTPAVGGSAYPTGTVTLTDGAGTTATVTLPGTGDTLSVPFSNLSVGTHTFTGTYSGDVNYVPKAPSTTYSNLGPYVITVNSGSLSASSTVLSGVPSATTFGTTIAATAQVTGNNPTGTVQFIVNGAVYATSALASGTATASLSLPLGTYSVSAVYDGDTVNAGSTSPSAPLTVSPAGTVTTLIANATTTTLGVPIQFTANVTSSAGIPSGTVNFNYTTGASPTVTTIQGTLTNGTAVAELNLPQGTNSVTATYLASGSFATSTSTPTISITVNPPVSVPLPTNPIPLPYTISTIAGGSTVTNADTTCAGSADAYGDGCQATATAFTGAGSALDLRSVVADPFGNVYVTDANASLIHRIAPNGVMTNYAGRVTGTACVPTTTAGCTPTLVSLNKPRGISADPAGNLYIAGYSDSKVYKVSASTGLLYLIAGTGTKGTPGATNGNGGSPASALLDQPRGVWADSVGNVYIADTANNQIRVVSAAGNIQAVTAATSTPTTSSPANGDGGLATSATVDNPQGVLTDASDNLYIADTNRIRVVCITCTPGSGLYALLNKLGIATPQNNYIYTLAGGGSSAYKVPALANTISMSPQKLAMDSGGNLYIADGGGYIWFVDSRTGYVRAIAGMGSGTTTCNPSASPNIGDGCAATQAIIGDGSGGGIGVGNDLLGNIYISDTLNGRVRKVSTGLQFPSTATGATTTQTAKIHFIAGDNAAATNALVYPGTEWNLTTSSCTTNTDTTTDCLISAAFTPAVAGARSTTLTVNSSAGNTGYFGLTGSGSGAGVTLDAGNRTSFGSNLQVAAVAIDNAGNIYVADKTSKNLLRFPATAVSQGGSAASTILATLTVPSAVTVDSRGYVYGADSSTGQITQVSPAGVVTTLPFKFTTPAGLAVDALNNLYVSDSSAQSIFELNSITGAQKKLAAGTLSAPVGLSMDSTGNNLLITDPGAGAVYRLNLQSGARTTITTPASNPAAIASDAAGNLLIADVSSIIAVPASAANSAPFTVAALIPSSLAIDWAGNLYTGSGGGVVQFTRTQSSFAFLFGGASQTASLMSSGNIAASLTSLTQSDSADYTLTATASPDCSISGSLPTAVAVGGVCNLTASYNPTTLVSTTDTVTFAGNVSNAALSTPASVQLILSGPAITPTLTLAVSPAISSAGQPQNLPETFTARLANGPTAMGSVTFYDGTVALGSAVALSNGAASLTVNSFTVATHSISAKFNTTGLITPLTSNTLSFSTISQLVPSFSISGPQSVVVRQGNSATTNVTISPGQYYGGTVTFSCSGAPSTLTCSFNPASLTFVPTSSAAQTTVLTLTAAPGSASLAAPTFHKRIESLTAILGLPCLLLLFARRRKGSYLRDLVTLAIMIAGSAGLISLTGCSNNSTSVSPAAGVYLIVNVTDGVNTHSYAVITTITQ